MAEVAKKLIRVTKRGGTVSIFLVNRYGVAIRKFSEDAVSALALLRSKSSYVYDEGKKYEAFSVKEARELFEKEGIKVIEIYLFAACWIYSLSPKKFKNLAVGTKSSLAK